MKILPVILLLLVTSFVSTTYATDPVGVPANVSVVGNTKNNADSKIDTVTGSGISSAPAQGGIDIGGFQISAGEIAILMAMLRTPFLKSTFISSCSSKSEEWLGTDQSIKTCLCAYNNLIQDQNLATRMIAAGAGNGDMSNFNKWGYQMIESCLPDEYPPEVGDAFDKLCLKSGDLNAEVCSCVLASFKRDFTVKALIKTAFEEPKGLQMQMMLKAAQCLAK